MIHYFDPSAWIKRYIREPGSDAVNALFSASVQPACCRLGLIEMIATVARRSRDLGGDGDVAQTVVAAIRSDFAQFHAVLVDERRTEEAIEAASRHGLRAMDAVHLACALSLGPTRETVLVSADRELLEAGAAAGLGTLDPSA